MKLTNEQLFLLMCIQHHMLIDHSIKDLNLLINKGYVTTNLNTKKITTFGELYINSLTL